MSVHSSVNKFRRQRPVVVTGGAGYIGSLVVRQLLHRGAHVRIVDNLIYGDGAVTDLLDHPACEFVRADFRDEIAIVDALSDAEAVIHLGAIVGDPACSIDEERTLSTNTAATALIADQCRTLGVQRLVFASTCSVYGASGEPLDETSMLNPVSLYAHSKREAELLLLQRQSDAFTPVILRFGTAYGAAGRYRFDLVVNLLTAKAVQDGCITIHGGDQWRPFIHAHDIARAVLLALDAPKSLVAGQIINVGADSQNYQLGEIGQIIQQLVPEAAITTSDEITDKRNYYVRFGKARELLGFHPTRTVQDGVRELTAALTQNSVGDYRNPRYHNAMVLRELQDARQVTGIRDFVTPGAARFDQQALVSSAGEQRQAG